MTDQTPEVAVADDGPLDVVGEEQGTPAPFSCPECGGVLSEVRDGTLLRFRCQTGHRFSPQSMAAQQKDVLNRALEGALTAVNERGLVLHRLAEDASGRRDVRAARRFSSQAREAEAQRRHMRRLLDGVLAALEVTEDATAADDMVATRPIPDAQESAAPGDRADPRR